MTRTLVGRDAAVADLDGELLAGRSVVIAGRAGVGKTAIGGVLGDRARERGWAVEHVVGTHAAQSLTFGAMARLLPDVQDQLTPQLLVATVTRIGDRASTTPLLLVVDDAHLLDPASATLVHHLVLDGATRCVVTVRTGEPCPDVILGIWKDGHAARVDLAPLDRDDASRLLETQLGGRVGTTLDAEVWRLTHGNPLFLREVVVAAQADGVLTRMDDTWVATGPLPTSQRLADVIDARLAVLDPRDRAAIELLAVGEPLRLAVASAAVGARVVDGLENRGLARVDATTGLLHAAHPMYGEVLRAAMPTSRRAGLASELADAVQREGTTDDADARAAARLLVEAGRPPPPDLALRGARAALGASDVELADRLARHAVEANPFEARLLLGRALRLRERSAEAESVLVAASRVATTDEQVADVALARARTCFWAQQDLEAAREILERARDEIDEPAWKATLETELALQLARFGKMARGAALAQEALDRPSVGPRAELAALVVCVLQQVLALDSDQLAERLERGLHLAGRLQDEEPLATDQLLLSQVTELVYVDLAAARRIVEERGARRSPMRGAWHMAATLIAIQAGQPAVAVVAANEARLAAVTADPFGNLPMIRAMQALALAQAGDAASLKEMREVVADPIVRREPRARVWADRARVWQAVLDGDVEQAVSIAAEGGTDAIEVGNVGWGANLLHEAVRLGAPQRVVDDLHAVTAGTGIPVAELFGRHAVALATGDVEELRAIASGFAAAGSPRYAADVLAQVAGLLTLRQQMVAAVRAAARAQVQAATCTGPPTPAMAPIEDLGLSARELELARLAVAGHSNRRIAEELVLSLRTVENHLSRAYHKLDVAGRGELQDVLG